MNIGEAAPIRGISKAHFRLPSRGAECLLYTPKQTSSKRARKLGFLIERYRRLLDSDRTRAGPAGI
jgi:hypothetical protein